MRRKLQASVRCSASPQAAGGPICPDGCPDGCPEPSCCKVMLHLQTEVGLSLAHSVVEKDTSFNS